jgi:glutamate racemase
MNTNDAPIGVFDSGIGGLTVVREIFRELPAEGVVYLGDTARVPYGIRSPETVKRYSLQCARFLLSRGIKLLVIACNTVSAVGLEGIRRMAPVPVIGVMEPGARAAAAASRNRKVGVIGTYATIKADSYRKAITALDGGVEVFSLACPLFVPMVEEGWLSGEVPLLTATRYLGGLRESGIDTLVLGCTHYPLLKPVISEVMDGVTLIDSATETAREVRAELEKRRLLGGGGVPRREFYVTDDPGKFRSVGERFLGQGIDNIKMVGLEEYE